MRFKINYTGFCIKGLERKYNEDNVWCVNRSLPLIHTDDDAALRGTQKAGKPSFFAVFDGTGKNGTGRAASFAAASSCRLLPFRQLPETENRTEEICAVMNRRIQDYADKHHIRSMGTAVAALLISRNGIEKFHLGSTRCYRFSKEDGLTFFAKDPAHETQHSENPVPARYLGIANGGTFFRPDTFSCTLRDGDIYMLCTDGVSNLLRPRRLSEILETARPLEEKKSTIKDILLKKGAPDNATALLVEIKKSRYPFDHNLFFYGYRMESPFRKP